MSVLRAFGAREIASGLGLLAQPDRAGWAWSRLGGNAIDLAFLGSAANEDSVNRQRVALAAAAVASITALDLICARGLQEEREQRRAAGGYMEDESVSSVRSRSCAPSRRCLPSGRATRTCRGSCAT